MRNTIILHGMPTREEYYDTKVPSASNANWIPWLQKQLLIHDIAAETPEMLYAFDPKYEQWVKEIERYTLLPDTLVVGHSCGGGFWVRYLSEHPDLRVGRVVLVAPWLDPDGNETKGFFEGLRIDSDLVQRTNGVVIFHSDNDMGNVHKSVGRLRREIRNVEYREFHGFGHFTSESMGGVEFPELRSELLKD